MANVDPWFERTGLPPEDDDGAAGSAGCYPTAIWVLLREDDCSSDELARRLIELGLDWRLVLNLPFVLRSMTDEDLVASNPSPTPEAGGAEGPAVYSLTAAGRQKLLDAARVMMRRREALDVLVERYLALGSAPSWPMVYRPAEEVRAAW